MLTAKSMLEEVNHSSTLTQEELFSLFSRSSYLVNDCVHLLVQENDYIQLRVLALGAEVASNLDRNKAIYRRPIGYIDDVACDVEADTEQRESDFLSACMDLQSLLISGDRDLQASLLLSLPLARMVYENFVKDWLKLVEGYEGLCLQSADSVSSDSPSPPYSYGAKCGEIERIAGISPRVGFGVVRYVRNRIHALGVIYDRIFNAYARVILKQAKSQSVSEDHSLDCLAGATLVWTDTGMVRIDEVGTCGVQTTQGVRKAYPHIEEEPRCLETVTSRSRLGLSLTGTPDHLVRVLNEEDQCLEWVTLSDSVGRYAAVATGSDMEWPVDPPIGFSVPQDTLKRKACIPSHMTPGIAALAGYLVAEGTVYPPSSPNKGTVSFSNSDKSLLRRYSDLMLSEFGVSPCATTVRPTGVVELITRDHNLNEFLRAMGCFCAKAEFKKVPWAVMSGSRDTVVSFLRAYWDGAGSLVDRPSCGSNSKELIHGIQQLLLRLGVVAKNTVVTRNTDYYGNPSGTKLHTHTLTVMGGDDCRRFIDRVGYASPLSATGYVLSRCKRNLVPGATTHGKNKHAYFCDLEASSPLLPLSGRFVFDKIVSVVPSGKQKVYDISVNDPSHEFVADGQVVSNCFQNGSLGLLRAISSYDNVSNARFAGHARWWIRQSMLYSIKEDSNVIRVSSNTWQHFAKIESTRVAYESKHGTATLSDLSRGSGYSTTHIESIYGMVRTSQVRSLDHPLREDGSSTLMSVIDADKAKNFFEERDSNPNSSVKFLLDRLPTDTRNLVCMAYGLTEYVVQNIPTDLVDLERLRQQ